MKIEFDPNKSQTNDRDRALPFAQVAEFNWESAIYSEDCRFLYSERRFIAMGYLYERLHVICFTPIEDGI